MSIIILKKHRKNDLYNNYNVFNNSQAVYKLYLLKSFKKLLSFFDIFPSMLPGF